MTTLGRFFLALFATVLLAGGIAKAQDRNIYVPNTISAEAQQVLRGIIGAKPYARVAPQPDDLESWRQLHAANEAALQGPNNNAVIRTGVTVSDAEMGGVPVLDIRPRGWKDNGKVLVYTHGGAYTFFSARSTLGSSAPMSHATGLRVISVNYTTAPFAKWAEIQEQVISVFQTLLSDGYAMEDIAIYGDSAGGGLAVSTILNLRERGMGMPAVAVLWSPWVDLTNAGDTAHTLSDADPTLIYDGLLLQSALAFADGLDLNDPRVSPLYAEFNEGFPPPLIQAGTKEILLSTAVRLYQKLEAAGQETKLDIYEGMWHVSTACTSRDGGRPWEIRSVYQRASRDTEIGSRCRNWFTRRLNAGVVTEFQEGVSADWRNPRGYPEFSFRLRAITWRAEAFPKNAATAFRPRTAYHDLGP